VGVRFLASVLAIVGLAACSAADRTSSADDDFTSRKTTDAGAAGSSSSSSKSLRIVAANITTGKKQKYDAGEGIRILQALKPDVALLQEMNYKSNSYADLDAFSAQAFGEGFTYFREDGQQIPNAVFSRYPIETSGRWADALAPNRGFAYAKIRLPNERSLWAVSVHLLTSSDVN